MHEATDILRPLAPFLAPVATIDAAALNALCGADETCWDADSVAELHAAGGTLASALRAYTEKTSGRDYERTWRLGWAAMPFMDAAQQLLAMAARRAEVGFEAQANRLARFSQVRPAWKRYRNTARYGDREMMVRGFGDEMRKVDANLTWLPWQPRAVEHDGLPLGAAIYARGGRTEARAAIGIDGTAGVLRLRAVLGISTAQRDKQIEWSPGDDDALVASWLDDLTAMVVAARDEATDSPRAASAPPAAPAPLEVTDLQRHLEAQPAVVLQGPPGSGKTHRVLALIDSLRGEHAREDCRWTTVGDPNADDLGEARWRDLPVLWEIVQLHPSYTYEDLVRGLTTRAVGEGVQFVVEDKLLVHLARAAAARRAAADSGDDPQRPTVLILDEINRCNLSAVLGELILVLEKGYRDMPVRLQYVDAARPGDATLMLPPNLWIVGTMNTADRSIAMVDFAIRRRFRFVDVEPDAKVIEALNARVAAEAVKASVATFEAFQGLLHEAERDRLAVGHSYFLLDAHAGVEWSEQLADRIVFEVLPLLREYHQEGYLQTPELRTDWLTWDARRHTTPDRAALKAQLDKLGAGLVR